MLSFFAAMLGTALATANWTNQHYWEALTLACVLLLQICLRPAAC